MAQIFNKSDEREKRQRLRQEMPHAERLLWRHLRTRPEAARFRRQVSVNAYVVDFYCPELRLVIEVDGLSHENDDAVIYDARRQKELENLGLHFLRVTNEQVFHDMDNVMEMVLAKIAALRSIGEGRRVRVPQAASHQIPTEARNNNIAPRED